MEGYPQLLNLNTNKRSHEASEDKNLELKLGPPGEEEEKQQKQQPLLSLHYKNPINTHKNHYSNSFLEHPSLFKNSDAKPSNTRVPEFQGPEKKACSTLTSCPANQALPDSTHRSVALKPVVGWPPVRSSRKNLSTSSSPKLGAQIKIEKKEMCGKSKSTLEDSLFVKINMDGVPIGRKIDLKSYGNYEKLSSAVDELFRGLLAAQGDASNEKMENTKAITGLLDGSADYTLVYEDNEGDRMLVGDVPWHMFISSAKRLRVLKKSELSTLP